MQNLSYPWLAFGLGLLVAFGLLQSGALQPDGNYALPMLTMLIINEFGFFMTAIGAGVGINKLLAGGVRPALLLVTLGCAVLAAGFLYLGIRLWPGGFPG
ncbi:MAG TPA: hypothetical protein VET88_05510 [Gammaproteobacteria bacterium]|nr:hypothetical protein [Gammaproteobacteria bacterium]